MHHVWLIGYTRKNKIRKEFAREQGLIFETVPRPHDVMDKIESVRTLFPQFYFDLWIKIMDKTILISGD